MENLYLTVKKTGSTGYGEIIDKLLYKKEVDFSDFDVSYATDLKTIILNYQKEIVEMIIERGFTEFVSIGPVNEEVITAGTGQNKIIDILIQYLDKVGIDQELIIIDPYFFAPTSMSNYSALIERILTKYISGLTELKIITTANPRKIDPTLKAQIISNLNRHKPTLNISHITSNNYHDRFWISNNRERGIITGTSLNGLGNRLALIDRLNTTDVRKIVDELVNEALI